MAYRTANQVSSKGLGEGTYRE